MVSIPVEKQEDSLDFMEQTQQQMHRQINEIDIKIRRLKAASVDIPEIRSFDGKNCLAISIAEEITPWSCISPKKTSMPGMISEEERKYYVYLGQFYSGQGNVVELGPWLGRSTFYILDGLIENPYFVGKKLHVFDDFVWRSSWMGKPHQGYLAETDRPKNHQDFQPLFERFVYPPHKDFMAVEKRRVSSYDGNDAVPQLKWRGRFLNRGPIEIMYVDCGRTMQVNEAWFSIFSDSFIPNKTLIIMQDWRLHLEVPVKWYNQTKQFTDSKESRLQLIHELIDGGVGTFLYKGQ